MLLKKKIKENRAKLPENYEAYIFDLYGTLVDIRTEENSRGLWEKLALFYGYHKALYTADEIRTRYGELVAGKEKDLKSQLETDVKYAHEANPEIELAEVFEALYLEKGVTPSKELVTETGLTFRVISTEHLCVYSGTSEMLKQLKNAGKRIYLLSNAQRIFTEYELHVLDIAKYFDKILISSDYHTKKPDKRFFDAMVTECNVDVTKSLFVGNDSLSDIAGAKQVDLDTYYVKSNISPEGDFADDATYSVDNFVGWEY